MKPTSEERVIAVISHLTALAFGAGLVLPAIMWSENRSKSAYIRFQTLQALGYQSLGYTVWLLGLFALVILFYILMFILALVVPNAAQNQSVTTVLAVLLMAMFFGWMAVYCLIAITGAVLCGSGKDFRYPVLGNQLARYLGYDDDANPGALLDLAAEERFAAAMGHFAVIIPIWGLLAPAYLWINQGKNSPFLKAQSAQTTIYQIFVNLLAFGLTLGSIALGIIAIPLATSYLHSGEWAAVAGMMVMICLLSCTGLMIPIFHIIGQWAGLRVLQGQDFRYPLLGRLVAKFSERSPKSLDFGV
jgi:uncharacterized Tic20 family protein